MTVPIKKSTLIGFTESSIRNYVLDLDDDIKQLYSCFHTLINLNKLQTNSYISQDGSAGTTTNISLAKLTTLGSDGSLTIKNGIVTNFVQPT
jgi:hypothetical protein